MTGQAPDVIVIGSGFGGALRSLFRTLRSALLPGGGFTRNPRGLFELHPGRALNVLRASGVGDRSHVYSGLNALPPDPRYWDDLTEGVSSATMAPNYRCVLEKLGSRSMY